LPWTSMIAAGKLESLVSSTPGRRCLATANKVSTSGDGSVARDHRY
jgi:hypothetical protein